MPVITKGYLVKHTRGMGKGITKFFTSKARAEHYAKKHSY